MIFKSIRWRLQIWYGFILVAVLTGFGLTAFKLESGRVFRKMDDELQRRASVLANVLAPKPRPPLNRNFRPPRDQNQFPPEDGLPPDGPPEGDRPEQLPGPPTDFHMPPRQAGMFDESDPKGYYYVIWRRDGTSLARSANAPETVSLPSRPPGLNVAPGRPQPPQPPRQRESFREAFIFTPPGEIVLAGRSVTDDMAELRRIALSLVAVGCGVLLIGLAGGWWLASRAIRPIEDISATASKISAGDLSQRINVADTDSELGKLAGVLNSTFGRLESSFAQQRQFTSDAAHELRTPVSVILTETQTTLARDRNAEEYRDTVQVCQRIAQRMRRLIESLLELARLDAGQDSTKWVQWDMAQTARDCVDHVQPLALERSVKIQVDLSTAECRCDPERMTQVVTNLLTNAIHYNKDGGEVRVTIRTENGMAVLIVADSGQGISPEHMPHIFDRFYRVDTARTTSKGRTGLGLAICKAIVEAHGGKIEVSSELEKGTTFTVKLPATA